MFSSSLYPFLFRGVTVSLAAVTVFLATVSAGFGADRISDRGNTFQIVGLFQPSGQKKGGSFLLFKTKKKLPHTMGDDGKWWGIDGGVWILGGTKSSPTLAGGGEIGTMSPACYIAEEMGYLPVGKRYTVKIVLGHFQVFRKSNVVVKSFPKSKKPRCYS